MATYIGLDLGGTNIKISVFDDFFHKLGEKRTPTEVRFGSEHVLNRIYDAVLALLDELHLTCQDITCMGIGVPGILDIKNGISRFSPNFPKWEEVPIVAWMESHLHIVKDGNAAAEAPAVLGAMFLPSVFCAPSGKKSNWDSIASSVTG